MSKSEPPDFDLQKVLDDTRENDRPQQHESELRCLMRRVDQLARSHHRTDDDQPRPQCGEYPQESMRCVADSICAAFVRVRHAVFRSLNNVCSRTVCVVLKIDSFYERRGTNELSQGGQSGCVVANKGCSCHFDFSGVNASGRIQVNVVRSVELFRWTLGSRCRPSESAGFRRDRRCSSGRLTLTCPASSTGRRLSGNPTRRHKPVRLSQHVLEPDVRRRSRW